MREKEKKKDCLLLWRKGRRGRLKIYFLLVRVQSRVVKLKRKQESKTKKVFEWKQAGCIAQRLERWPFKSSTKVQFLLYPFLKQGIDLGVRIKKEKTIKAMVSTKGLV